MEEREGEGRNISANGICKWLHTTTTTTHFILDLKKSQLV